MKFTIDRKKWLREASETSYLLSPRNGKMCCLGFYAKACGYSDEEIEGFANPDEVLDINKFGQWLFKKNIFCRFGLSLDARNLIQINDERYTKDFYKEKMIIEIFANNGIEVEFVG